LDLEKPNGDIDRKAKGASLLLERFYSKLGDCYPFSGSNLIVDSGKVKLNFAKLRTD